MFRKKPAAFTILALVVWSFQIDVARADGVSEVDVPEVTRWCITRPAKKTDMSDSSFQRKEISEVMLLIGKAANKIGISQFGVPSVDSFNEIDDQSVSVGYCTSINATDPPPSTSGFVAKVRPAIRVLATECGALDNDACETKVVSTASGPPWNISADDAAGLVHHMVSVAAVGSSQDRVIVAVNDTTSHLYDAQIGLVIATPINGPVSQILALELP